MVKLTRRGFLRNAGRACGIAGAAAVGLKSVAEAAVEPKAVSLEFTPYDGDTYYWDNPQWVPQSPPEHINCRCLPLPREKFAVTGVRTVRIGQIDITTPKPEFLLD